MLWLAVYFPHLPAEALGLRDPGDVVTEQRGARRWLITTAAGLAPGTPLGVALSIAPALRAQPRRAAAEQAMLLRLAHGLYRYGSPVCAEIRDFDEPGRAPLALLWIEIAASLRLFGGVAALCAALRADLDELEHRAQLAIAPTRAAAALFAIHAQPGVQNITALEARLARLPIDSLPWSSATLDALRGVGLRRLGELFALPRAAFARRFGIAALRELDVLRGLAAEPAEAIVPPARFRRRFELPGEVETIEALSFPLRRLALELQYWLRARDAGVRAVQLVCEHAQRRRSRFTLRYGNAHRDGQRLFETLRERLTREPLAGAVRALRLEALEVGSADIAQADLFEHGDSPRDWQTCIERIAARLGDSAVWTPALNAGHRPEHALARIASTEKNRVASQLAPMPDAPRPLWLLREPRAMPAPALPAAFPERIESGWWDKRDTRRDYYRLDTPGARCWVFRERGSGHWFLHGLWG